MDIKTNDSTHNRPAGKRLVDAPAVFIDIEEHVKKLKGEVAWQKNDRNGITVFKSGETTVVVTALHRGAAMENLEVDGLILLQVMQGTITISAPEEDEKSIASGQLMVFHAGQALQVNAVDDAVIMLTTISQKEV